MTTLETSRLGAWSQLDFFGSAFDELSLRLVQEQSFLPPEHQVFAALEATQPDAVSVVILGQDPYPTPGHAHGFAFSAEADTHPLPRSLGNIYREMTDDLGACPPNADLRFWAAQGVLLLNSTLTVRPHEAGSHAKLGWQALTTDILRHLADRPRAYLLWGAHAQKAASDVDVATNLKIETAHPSPLSARRGFFGSRPFSRVNAWLQAHGHPVINWTDPGETS